jgi:hypothetical protein
LGGDGTAEEGVERDDPTPLKFTHIRCFAPKKKNSLGVKLTSSYPPTPPLHHHRHHRPPRLPFTSYRTSRTQQQGTYGYLTATGELVLQLAGPTVYVGFDAKPMSIFFRADVRSTAGGDVTQLRFLIRKTSSNIQVGGAVQAESRGPLSLSRDLLVSGFKPLLSNGSNLWPLRPGVLPAALRCRAVRLPGRDRAVQHGGSSRHAETWDGLRPRWGGVCVKLNPVDPWLETAWFQPLSL